MEGGVVVETPENCSSSLIFTNAGIGLDAFYNLFSCFNCCRRSFRNVQLFLWQWRKNYSASDLYYRGYGELGFRFNPSITLSATGGYQSSIVHNGNPVLSGSFAGLSIKFNFSTGKSARAACYADLDNYGDYLSIVPAGLQNHTCNHCPDYKRRICRNTKCNGKLQSWKIHFQCLKVRGGAGYKTYEDLRYSALRRFFFRTFEIQWKRNAFRWSCNWVWIAW